MFYHISFRSLILAFVAALTLVACNEPPQPESAKVTVTTDTPASLSSTDRYPATLAEGIDFSKTGYPDFLTAVGGMSYHEPWGRWSDGETVVFQFTQPLPTDFTLVLTARAFGPNIGAPIQVKAGASEQTVTLTADDQTHRLDFSLAAPTDRIEFKVPQPISPADLQQGEDPRKLGIGLVKLQLGTAEAPAATSSPTLDESAYAAEIIAANDRLELEQGGFTTVTFTLTNHGSLTWASEPPNPVNFSYHLLDNEGEMLEFDNPRTAFPEPVAPGQTATLALKLGADQFPGPGEYRLEFDVVHEGQTWFAEKGSPTLTLPITVAP